MKFPNLGLSARITLGAVLAVALGGVVWIERENETLRQQFIEERAADLESALSVGNVRISQSVETLRQDALFLSNTPPVGGIMRAVANQGFDPRDKNSYTQWEIRLQEIFAAFLRAHPDYDRVRYIGVAHGGRELVRVERNKGRIEIVARQGLQARGSSDYFQVGLGLKPGQVHFSEFNLNREYGKIENPPHPTVRAVTPVIADNGKIFGMIVINRDAGTLLASAMEGLPTGVVGYVSNEAGQYLHHPDAGRAFEFELGGDGNIVRDFPVLASLLSGQGDSYMRMQAGKAGDYWAAERIPFDAGSPARFLLLAYRLPGEAISGYTLALPSLYEFAWPFLLLGVLAWGLLHRAFAPLRRITRTAHQIAEGNRELWFRERSGEMGELSEALNVMLDKLTSGEVSERENAFRKEMIESLPGVFYMLDAQGYFLMWNHNFARVLGVGENALSGRHALSLFAGDDKALIEARIREVFERGESSVEAALVTAGGKSIPYHFTGRRVLHNGRPVLIGLGLDISVQRDQLRAVEALLRRNRALMMSSMEGIHVMDINGNVLEVNDAFCAMLGYTREEAMRLNVRDWDDRFSEEDLRRMLPSFIGRSDTFDTVHKRKDGSLIEVEICTTGVEIDGTGYLFASSRDITDRKRAERVMLNHHLVIETALDGYWMTDADGFLQEANESYSRMSGYQVWELVGMHISELEATERPQDVKAHIDRIIAQGRDRFETQHRRKDGTVYDLEISVTFRDGNFYVFCRDIAERKQAEMELRIAAAAFETRDGILITDADGNIIRVNRAFTEITGYTQEEVIGRNPRFMRSGRHDNAFYQEMWRSLLETGIWAGEIWDRRKSGEVYPKWTTITAVKDAQGATTQYAAIFSDISERKHAENEIRNLAFYDPLTQLPNRRLLLDRLLLAMRQSGRANHLCALMFLDLDHFKVLNDTKGHEYGDLMLVEVAKRLNACVRETDMVARFGGDEFVILLEGLHTERDDAIAQAGRIAEKMRDSLSQPFFLKDESHLTSPSIGVVLFQGEVVPIDELLKQADLAMYQAKESGRNLVRFFEPSMQAILEARTLMENALRQAMPNQELFLSYQLQTNERRELLGAEVLLRWRSEVLGMVPPSEFIPLAEKTKLILPIGKWVLESACLQLKAWEAHPVLGKLRLAVNISPVQFHQPEFVRQVKHLLQQTGADPRKLELELTENLVLENVEEATGKMLALKECGVRFSMDDFGTGYSSLQYIKRLPIDQLKIDQSFVRDILNDAGDAMMVQTIAGMAHSFGFEVIAEGVETVEQLSPLVQRGCSNFQGFLFARPLPAGEFEKLVDDWERKH